MSSNTPSRSRRFVAEIDDTPMVVDQVDESAEASSLWRDAWRALRRRPMFWVSAVLIVVIVAVSLFPFLFTGLNPNYGDITRSNDDAAPGHPLGFDQQGYDILARVIYGAQSSLSTGLIAMILVVLIGGVFGAIAGYYGGWFDTILSRVGDIFFAIPTVLGAIVVMQTIPGSRTPVTVALVLALFAWPQMARIMRGAVLSAKGADYVTASIALGVSRFAILVRHVIPNAIAPVIVLATTSLGTFIVAEATLSFLGIGLPPSTVSWGGDISRAQAAIRVSPENLFFPSVALAITVLAFLMLGDVVRDALDPKARARR
jgi:oligopeptide transport system permease protein